MPDKVIVKRYPDEFFLIGAPTTLLTLDEAADALYRSGFMKNWIIEKIRAALIAEESFKRFGKIDDVSRWKGREDGLVAEYRLATHDEEVMYVNEKVFAATTGRKATNRAQITIYTLHYLDSDKVRQAYDELPRQAKTILDILNETGKVTMSDAVIEMLITEKAERLKTKQPPARVYAFYRKRLVDEGHLVEGVSEEDVEE